MELNRIISALKADSIVGPTDKDVTGVCIDSRKASTGNMFVAVKGTQTDGHAYIGKALEQGATVVVHSEEIPDEIDKNITFIRVKDTEEAAGIAATTFYGNPTARLRLVGVTGTNGKTTIATVLYNLFRGLGYKCGLCSTVCNYIDGEEIPTEHTTPDPVTLNELLGRMADAGCQFAFMECSSHAIQQKRIAGLTGPH